MTEYRKEFFSDKVVEVVNVRNSANVKGRYDNKCKLRLDDDKLIIRNLKEADLKAKETSRDIVHRVTVAENERPDLIAHKYYGDPRMYWVVLGANNLREKAQVKEGMLVRIPARNTLYGNDGLLLR